MIRMPICVKTRIFLRLNLSARTPAGIARNRTGIVRQKLTHPTAARLSVSSHTSQLRATISIQRVMACILTPNQRIR